MAIFDDTAGTFLGMEVHDVQKHESVSFDLLIVGSLELNQHLTERLIGLGITADRLVMLRAQPQDADGTRPTRTESVPPTA